MKKTLMTLAVLALGGALGLSQPAGAAIEMKCYQPAIPTSGAAPPVLLGFLPAPVQSASEPGPEPDRDLLNIEPPEAESGA